jgi:hypothetical protein
VVVAASGAAFAATTTDVSGTLFYTTNSALVGTSLPAATVDSVTFNWSGGVLALGTPKTVSTLVSGQNADGIIFDASGNIMVGSAGINIPALGISGTNEIIKMSQAGVGLVNSTTPDGPFHLALNSTGTTVYSGGTFGPVTLPIIGTVNIAGDTPGKLVSTPAALGTPGTLVTTSGSDTTFTQLAFTKNGTVFYTSAPATGSGNYGTINLTTGVTTRIGTGAEAHGAFYDPFSDTVILTGGDTITQINATTGAVLSSISPSGATQLDQGTSDGDGHLFIGDNGGNLILVDLSATKSLTGAVTTSMFLQTNLDDLAPLNSFGPPVTVPPPPTTPPPPPTTPPPPPTTPPPPTAVPLPASVWTGLTVLSPLVIAHLRRRRKTT